ncbi:MAG: hypothetical protein MK212_19730 [Saprospiraceae bacterium]|nr:hypothetical protein [Saprospiraceae bacterium]
MNTEVLGSEIDKKDWRSAYKSLRFFSRRAILFFSIFCTPVWGAVLFSDNLLRTGRRIEGFKVVSYAVIYTASIYLPFRLLIPPLHPAIYVGIALGASTLGASVLTTYFWKKYIGEDTVYTPKPLTGPFIVIILMLIASSFVVLIIMSSHLVTEVPK